MPNHTSNFVVVETNTGCSKEQLALAELKTKLSIMKGEFDFEGMIPMPKDLAKSFDVHDPLIMAMSGKMTWGILSQVIHSLAEDGE